MITAWPSAAGGEEYALAFDHGREKRLLVIPALFDEANKTRHLLVETLRRLDKAGIDSFLPDLPGCNESLAPLEAQTLSGWRKEAQTAASHFGATHVLAVRAGAILVPPCLAGWRYAPTSGAATLRSLLRARVFAAQEAGRAERSESLLAIGLQQGLELAGYRLGSVMIGDLEKTQLPDNGKLADISQAMVGGAAPWLRAEPAFDPLQADALAAVIAVGLAQ